MPKEIRYPTLTLDADFAATTQVSSDFTLPILELETPQTKEKIQTENYVWPMPPNLHFALEKPQEEAEPCRLILNNGTQVTARLVFFLPDQQAINIQIPPSRTTLTIRFDTFRVLYLSTPITAQTLNLPTVNNWNQDEHIVPFNILFEETHPHPWRGHTCGAVTTDFGYFLFLPLSESSQKLPVNQLERAFIPQAAIRDIHIGNKLGELLVQNQILTEQQLDVVLDKQKQLRERKLGQVLVEKNILSPADLLEAIQHQESRPVMKLGEALLEMGVLNQTQLSHALLEQKTGRKKPLGELLVELGIVSEEQLQLALAKKLGFPLIKLDNFPIEGEALLKVPATTATKLKILPTMLREQMLVVAMEDPWRYSALEELKFTTQLKIVPVMAPPRSIEAAIYRNYVDRPGLWQVSADNISASSLASEIDLGGNVKDIALELEAPLDSEDDNAQQPADRQVKENDNALVRLVNSMILEAYQKGASDIHIECYPGKEKVRVRFRLDGSLIPYLELPASHRAPLIARLKIMADLDISEKRKPQDGKINFAKFGPARIELRLASIPTVNNLEDMVLRILTSAKPLPLDNLGLAKRNVDGIHRIMERPYGLFLICGPTGSGKTTTLHSAISYINVPERKIWTAEDPVEITQPGLRQVQVHPKIGWTFAAALRAFLRADPDVIMVGEMRDEETAHIAVEASLTGHLVLSTLHTNSASESVTRLLDMGLDPFNFGDSLLGVLAQRLVKKMCQACRIEEPADAAWIEQLLDEYCYNMPTTPAFEPTTVRQKWQTAFAKDGQFKRYRCTGCEECNQTGLKGRLGIHELLSNSRPVKQLIQKGARAEEIQAQALLDGMRTLKQDGIEKVLQGFTTLEEVRAATAS